MITVKTFVFNSFQVNCYLLYDETKEAVLIDAACSESEEQHAINKFISDNDLTLTKLVNTHCHIDHLLGAKYIHSKYQVPFYACKDDYYLMANASDQALMFGFEMDLPPDIDQYIDEGDTVTFGNSSLKVLKVPGHSLGSVAFYSETDAFVIVGDVLFSGSIGRTDLPGGDTEQLMSSIKNKLFTLPSETKVYSGHGPETTIKTEHDTNPFFN